jgi:hypothetical protein
VIGERGGTTASLDEARELQEAHRAHWSAAIRAEIMNVLELHPEVHADDLLTLGIPPDCKNIVGAQFNALVRSGRIVETGERRKSAAPESHGRKSNCYKLRQVQKSGLARSEVDLGAAGGSPRGGSSDHIEASQCLDAAAISGEVGGGTSSAPAALPTLFEVEPVKGRSHYEGEAA